MTNLTSQIKNNAAISYLFILINVAFLFAKKNEKLNNNFVKSHTKSAIFIHIAFLINTIIFVYFWLGFYYEILWYNISDIIAISIYLILFSFLVNGSYKAYKWENFNIAESINYKNNKKLLDLDSDSNFNEKDKLTITLSRVPLLWFIIYPKYSKNNLIKYIVKLNSYSSFIIILLYIFWNKNLASFLLLIYIIFIVFTAINLYLKNQVIKLNLDFLPNINDILKYIKATKTYMWNYFSKSSVFPSIKEIIEKQEKENLEKNILSEKELQTKVNFKLAENIIYIPILNLISLFNLNTKQKKHIINWVLISILLIISYITYWINNLYQILLIIPLSFAFWYLKAWIMNYEIPILYDIFNIFIWIKNYISSIFKKAKKIKNTSKEVNLKVKNNNQNFWEENENNKEKKD